MAMWRFSAALGNVDAEERWKLQPPCVLKGPVSDVVVSLYGIFISCHPSACDISF